MDAIAAFVHTHGTRLFRLAHVLEVADPARTAADAVASTVMRRRRGGDAHDALLTAARAVGAQARPPVRDDARLQGWLDRAETAPYEADLDALRSDTAVRVELQHRRRSSTRRRAGAGTVAAALLVGVASLLTGGAEDAAQLPSEQWGWHPTGAASATQQPALVGLPPAGSVLLPRQLQSANGVLIADMLLLGPAVPIARVDVATGPATMLAVEGVTRRDSRVVCVLAVPDGQSLQQADEADVVAILPAPMKGRLLSRVTPLTVRQSIVENYRGRNLLLDVTSSRIDNALVTLADGRQVLAHRYSAPDSDVALFVTVDDASAAEILYFSRKQGVVRRKALYTATP